MSSTPQSMTLWVVRLSQGYLFKKPDRQTMKDISFRHPYAIVIQIQNMKANPSGQMSCIVNRSPPSRAEICTKSSGGRYKRTWEDHENLGRLALAVRTDHVSSSRASQLASSSGARRDTYLSCKCQESCMTTCQSHHL